MRRSARLRRLGVEGVTCASTRVLPPAGSIATSTPLRPVSGAHGYPARGVGVRLLRRRACPPPPSSARPFRRRSRVRIRSPLLRPGGGLRCSWREGGGSLQGGGHGVFFGPPPH